MLIYSCPLLQCFSYCLDDLYMLHQDSRVIYTQRHLSLKKKEVPRYWMEVFMTLNPDLIQLQTHVWGHSKQHLGKTVLKADATAKSWRSALLTPLVGVSMKWTTMVNHTVLNRTAESSYLHYLPKDPCRAGKLCPDSLQTPPKMLASGISYET